MRRPFPRVSARPKSTSVRSLTDDFRKGGESILRAFTRDDFPEEPERIFLTSWGEWWPSSMFERSLDKSLQDKWCPSKDEIEKEEGLTA